MTTARWRVCSEPNCGELHQNQRGRCDQHAREADRARGSRQDRGYTAEHVRLRKTYAAAVATGTVKCWRCRELIAAGEPWDLGHADGDRTRYLGPEHQRCNRATAGRR